MLKLIRLLGLVNTLFQSSLVHVAFLQSKYFPFFIQPPPFKRQSLLSLFLLARPLLHHQQVLMTDASNVEAIACLASHHFYTDQPEIALRFYRRLLQVRHKQTTIVLFLIILWQLVSQSPSLHMFRVTTTCRRARWAFPTPNCGTILVSAASTRRSTT